MAGHTQHRRNCCNFEGSLVSNYRPASEILSQILRRIIIINSFTRSYRGKNPGKAYGLSWYRVLPVNVNPGAG